MTKRLQAIAMAFLVTVGGAALAIEEPTYEVIDSTESYEIRRYAPFMIAEVDVSGDMNAAGSEAFRILAAYIFGDNAPGEKMQMTAPVVSGAPAADKESYTYAFVMEARFTPETLPAPLDPRIRIVEKPAQVIAARAFSGRWTEGRYRNNETALINSLASDGLRTQGDPLLARYNGPMTPWFMRRNEVLVQLDWE